MQAEPSGLESCASVVVAVFFVHANDLVVGREQRHGHTEHEGEEAPVETLLNEEQLEGEDHEEKARQCWTSTRAS